MAIRKQTKPARRPEPAPKPTAPMDLVRSPQYDSALAQARYNQMMKEIQARIVAGGTIPQSGIIPQSGLLGGQMPTPSAGGGIGGQAAATQDAATAQAIYNQIMQQQLGNYDAQNYQATPQPQMPQPQAPQYTLATASPQTAAQAQQAFQNYAGGIGQAYGQPGQMQPPAGLARKQLPQPKRPGQFQQTTRFV